MAEAMTCRSCGKADLRPFLDLGRTPLADALVDPARVGEDDRFELVVALCEGCALVQLTEEVDPAKLFVDNYLYFSSYSEDVARHSAEHARELIASRSLGPESLVVELASNDGYLLKCFAREGIPVLGVDPAPDQASAAEAAGIPTLREFFGPELAESLRGDGRVADVIIAKNVMAHVPDLNGFVSGMRTLMAEDGEIHVENPYVVDLITHREFDTIYHEHLCYFSCTSVDALARRNDLHLNDVVYFPELHGGTLRWVLGNRRAPTEMVERYLADEERDGVTRLSYYSGFAQEVSEMRRGLLTLLHRLVADGARIAGYGAAAKGSTLLNYVGIGRDLVDYVVDRNPHKQGLLMPGTHQPIRHPDVLTQESPDYVLLLAWNFRDEVIRQQQSYLDRGGRFIVPVPKPQVVS